MVPTLALLLAWALDRTVGEPRNAWHPVAWIGRALGWVSPALLRLAPQAAFVAGLLAWCALALAVVLVAAGLQWWLLGLPTLAAVPLLALAIKPGFAWRMLRDEVRAVEATLNTQGLPAARARLSRLVSRDVQALDAAGVRGSAISTLAENLNDSVVAPLFWFALAGLPGLWLYRFANTADAMWGHRGRWEWAGKWAAWADDGLSWAPARLTALLLWRPRAFGWRALRQEAARTPSPNGGWPMSAMAMGLDVVLVKPGVYRLNGGGVGPVAGDVGRAIARAEGTATLALAAALFATWAGAGA